MLSLWWGARTSADEMKMACIMAEATTLPLWMDGLLRHVNTGKKKSKTMRAAIREHARKWIAEASALRRMLQQRTREQELMQWIYRICHHRHVCNKFPDCSNSDNEVTDFTVSSQHFGVQRQYWERLLAPAFEIIRGWHQSLNIILMQMSVWLWACLCVVTLRSEEQPVISQRRSSFKIYSKYSLDMNTHLHHRPSSSLSTRPSSS